MTHQVGSVDKSAGFGDNSGLEVRLEGKAEHLLELRVHALEVIRHIEDFDLRES